MADDEPDEADDEGVDDGVGVALCVPPEDESDESPELEEHPVTARANKQVSPAAGFRKLLI